MTATSQHGFHPDAESLSAFSEQALGKRERADVLAHLAVCGRCREVVTLAREAADASAVPAAAPTRKATAASAWWRQWRLVWVPTAIVTAFAAASISVYIQRADRRESEFKIESHEQAQSTPAPSTPSSTNQSNVEPPVAAAPATSPVNSPKREHSAAAEPRPAAAPPAMTAQTPPMLEVPKPEAVDQMEARQKAKPTFPSEAQQAPPEFVAGAREPKYSQREVSQWEARKQAEEQRQVEVDKSRMRFFKSKAAPAAIQAANPTPPADASQSVTVAAAPPPVQQPDASAEPAPMLANKSSGTVPNSAEPMQLPSGLAAISNASRGRLLLAIDKAGALFLSEDHGTTWERIATQWTGRAVGVRQQAQVHGALFAAPAAQNGPAGSSSAVAGLPPRPTVFFELSNDENQTWVSTDGRNWTAK